MASGYDPQHEYKQSNPLAGLSEQQRNIMAADFIAEAAKPLQEGISKVDLYREAFFVAPEGSALHAEAREAFRGALRDERVASQASELPAAIFVPEAVQPLQQARLRAEGSGQNMDRWAELMRDHMDTDPVGVARAAEQVAVASATTNSPAILRADPVIHAKSTEVWSQAVYEVAQRADFGGQEMAGKLVAGAEQSLSRAFETGDWGRREMAKTALHQNILQAKEIVPTLPVHHKDNVVEMPLPAVSELQAVSGRRFAATGGRFENTGS